MSSYFGTLKKYGDFSGRASRKEYWIFVLITSVVIFGFFVLAGLFANEAGEPHSLLIMISAALMLLTLLPTLAVTARRLHDTDKSAWWMLLLLVPLAGVVVTVFTVLKGNPGENRFGPHPDTR